MAGNGSPLLIVQLTDIHIGFDPDEKPEEYNRIRFRATLDRIMSAPNAPDMVVLTGDITDKGDEESYTKTVELLQAIDCPIHVMVGNHDSREGLLGAFPETPTVDGFVQYSFDSHGLHVICLDTLEPGRHGGAFCEKRAEWLKADLEAHSETPTLIFMHHPPVVAGIGWMDPGEDEDWVVRFGDTIEGHNQIKAIHCGHLHRPISTTFRGIPLSVTRSTAPLVAMDLRPIDPDTPDDRDLITTESPTYAMHRWDGQNLLTHYEEVSDWRVLASYTPQLQGMIQEMVEEKGH